MNAAEPALPAAIAVRSRLSWAITLLVVAAGASIPFLPALDGGFLNWDDEETLVRNEHFRGVGWTQLRWMLSAAHMAHWIPLTWLSFGTNYALGGMNPWGYHAGNILLHAASALLFALVARRLLEAASGDGTPPGALDAGVGLSAVLFALHPLRVESVAWITERRDVLSGFFFLLSVWAYLRAASDGRELRRAWYFGSLAAFAGALLSKASVITLPGALLLLDVYPLGRRGLGWRRLVGEKAPYVLLSGAGAAAAVWAVRQTTLFTGLAEYGVGARLGMTAYSFLFYPWKWLWPAGLSPMYELPARVDLLAPSFLVPLLAVPVLTAALVVARRRWPAGLAVWAYSCLMVLPVSGAVHAGYQLAHDRYSYLSGLGLALLGGAALVAVLHAGAHGRLRPWLAGLLLATSAVVALSLGIGSYRQSRLWRDSETLWGWAVDLDPACALCHNNLGSAIIHGGAPTPARGALAEPHFRRAIELRPERPKAYHNLGGALALQGRFDEAEVAFKQFLRLSPNVPEAPGRLGMLYVDRQRYAEAIPLLRRALDMEPDFAAVRADLARALRKQAEAAARMGRGAEADALTREAQAVAAGPRE